MQTLLSIGKDINGVPSYDIPFSQVIFKTTLVGGATPVPQSFTVPASQFAQYRRWKMLLSTNPGANVIVARNKTATIPPASFVQTSDEDLNPAVRKVFEGDILSFITPDDFAYVYAILELADN